jgi:hypothetical protein
VEGRGAGVGRDTDDGQGVPYLLLLIIGYRVNQSESKSFLLNIHYDARSNVTKYLLRYRPKIFVLKKHI